MFHFLLFINNVNISTISFQNQVLEWLKPTKAFGGNLEWPALDWGGHF